MFQVSPEAGHALKTALEHVDASDEVCVRLALSPEGPLMEIDREEFNDESYSYQGKKVLVVDPESADALSNDVLDVEGNEFCLLHREESFSEWNGLYN